MQVARTKENLKRCQCMDCPSYTTTCKVKSLPENLYHMMGNLEEVDHYESMFCAFEKSHCIEEDRGCLCDTCPVHKEYNLKREDYCLQTGGLDHPSEKCGTCTAGYKNH